MLRGAPKGMSNCFEKFSFYLFSRNPLAPQKESAIRGTFLPGRG